MTNKKPINEQDIIYEEYIPLMKKTIRAKQVDIEHDTDIIHDWMNKPHVSKFWHMAWPREKIRDYLQRCANKEGFDAYIAYMEDEPMVYFELYQPYADPVGQCYEAEEGDLGLHVLIGEEKYQRRYIIRLSTMMMRLVFNFHPETQRIIGEPDINNTQIQGVMKFVGFKWMANVQLPDKIGALHGLRREDFALAHDLHPPLAKVKAPSDSRKEPNKESSNKSSQPNKTQYVA